LKRAISSFPRFGKDREGDSGRKQKSKKSGNGDKLKIGLASGLDRRSQLITPEITSDIIAMKNLVWE